MKRVLNAQAIRTFAELREHQRVERRIDVALQVLIAVLSLIAIACITSTGPAHRWGFVVGLASQPFWIAATWRARQWGMLVLSIAYVGMWTQGIFNRFTF